MPYIQIEKGIRGDVECIKEKMGERDRMDRVKPSKETRALFQTLAIVGGLVLIVHGSLVISLLNLTPLLKITTYLEILIGLLTIYIDTWFLVNT